MKKTPLFPQHLAHGARPEVYGDWLLPADYSDTDAEVRAARDGAVIFDLAPLEKVTLTGEGPEVRRFCNGMFTNNVKRMAPGKGGRSAMCDDRGRVQGLLDLYCDSDSSFLAIALFDSVARAPR